MHSEINFPVILEQYMPMILRTIRKWNLYSEKEEYIQIGRIALYEAWLRFETTAGDFAPYAKSYISGKIRHELARRNKIQLNSYSSSPERFADEIILCEQEMETTILLTDVIERAGLSPRERDWAVSYIIEDMKPLDISHKYNVSVTTVQSWRKSALIKLQRLQHLLR